MADYTPLVTSDGEQDRKKAARQAFANGDIKASIAAHNLPHTEDHGDEGSEYIKSLVFGGLDGIVTTFAIVAGAYGGNLGTQEIILFGFAGLIADGISMGLGDYFSGVAELDYLLLEKKREVWEFQEYPEGEKKEMVDILVEKHDFLMKDAEEVIGIYSQYPEAFIDLMMQVELGLEPPDEDDRAKTWKNGIVMLLSFWAFGSTSLAVYIVADLLQGENPNNDVSFALAALSVALSLFSLGAFAAKFTQQPRCKAGVQMLANGSIASIAAFIVAFTLEKFIPAPECTPEIIANC